MPEPAKPVSTFRKALAGILDFLTVFFVGGYLIGRATGNLTDGGFDLQGWPAVLLFAIVAAYFVLGWKYLGGTIWQRVLRTR